MESLIRKYELIIVWTIFILGAFLRLYHLDYPLGLHGDEAWSGIEAQRILQTGWIGIWSPSALGQPSLPFYWTALIFAILGKSLFSLRFSFAILHVISLPFLYFAMRYLFSRNVAIISFLLYVTSSIFLTFSHVAPTHTLFMVPFSLTLFLFFYGLKTKKTALFILAGIFLGLSPYFYVGLRIFPILFLVFLLIKSFQKHFLKTYWMQLVLFFLTAFAAFLPLGVYGLQHQHDFMTRTSIVSIFSIEAQKHEQTPSTTASIHKNLKKIFYMFIYKGDVDPQDNYMSQPILSYVTFFFFVIGFITQLFFLVKDEKKQFLYIWFFLFLSGTLFTVDAPNYRRIQPSILAIYIFVALGIVWIYKVITKYIPSSKIILQIIFGIAILFIVYSNVSFFFVKQAVGKQTKDINAYPLVKVSEFLHMQPQPVYAYFYSDHWSYHYETIRFLDSDISGEDRSKQFGTYSLDNSHPTETVVYLFLPEYEESFTALQTYCPNGKQFIEKDTDGQTIFFAYIIPKHTCQ